MFGLMATSPTAAPAGGHETLPEWSGACGSMASATRSACISRAIRSKNTRGSSSPSSAAASRTSPAIAGAAATTAFRFKGKPVTVAGMVLDIGKRGQRVIFTLDDRSGRMEVTMFEDVYQQYRALIAKSAILVVEGSLRWDEFIEGWRLTAKKRHRHRPGARAAREAPGCCAGRPGWKTNGQRNFLKQLEQTLRPFRGGRCAVAVYYHNSAARAELVLSEEWCVKPTREVTERLSQLCGHDGFKLIYGPPGG